MGWKINASNMHTSKLDKLTQCWTLYLTGLTTEVQTENTWLLK